MKKKEYRELRGHEIAMIFQNPLSAMDPSFKIGNQLIEIIRAQQGLKKKEALAEARKLLTLVGIPDLDRVLISYPHALSGGMRQRVIIAMALSCKPKLLIADEPTTALDATVQKQILGLLKRINKELGTSILFITHDLGVVANLCDRVAVMYAGKVVEYGKTVQTLKTPQHPYTRGLLAAMPESIENNEQKRLYEIVGSPPDMLHPPSGCSFFNRCSRATRECSKTFPERSYTDNERWVRCFHREVYSDE